MKRIASLILCALMVLSSFVLFAVPASAAEKVVYVKDGGTGDGSAAESPLGTLDAAFNALAAAGGKIVLVGDTTLVANNASTNATYPFGYYSSPAHDRQITITSQDIVNKAKLIWTDDCQWFAISGPTVIENVKMVNTLSTGQCRVLARANHLTMGEGLEMYLADAPQDHSAIAAGFSGFSLVGLATAGAEYDGMLDDNSWITIKSGVYSSIFGKTHNVNTSAGELTGNTYFEFLGDFAVREMGSTSWAGADQIHDVGEAYVVFDGKVTCWRYFPGYNYVSRVPYTCNFFVLGGSYVDVNGAPLALVGAAKVKTLNVWYDDANTEASDLALQFGMYSISQAEGSTNLNELKNYTGTAYRLTEDVKPLDDAAVTEAPVVTEAPTTEASTTEAPIETEATVDTTVAPETPEDTPATGDASLMIVFAAAAVLCVAAVVVIKKKEN